jgi:histidyl-tRNA synthetase
MSSNHIQSLPGFRDFFPEELSSRRHIFSAWRRVGERYGFSEYDGPPLEPLELYTRKSGDDIVGQLYEFEDKGGRPVALRPEMTPTFVRMIALRAAALPKPIRWFSIPQLFRYERPQRGRLREHFQLNMDIVGETNSLADAEIIAAGIDALRELGLNESHILVRVSDRRLMVSLLDAIGVAGANHHAVFNTLDRLDKKSVGEITKELQAIVFDEEVVGRILELTERSVSELKDEFADHENVMEAADGLVDVLTCLEKSGLEGYAEFDASLVRGLAYYTGTVFEIWEREGQLRAVCGGGRYDDLLQALGGVDLPAVGFGMGDVVLTELLKEHQLMPAEAGRIDDYIVCVSEEERATALQVAHSLRDSGRRVAQDLRSRKVGRQLKAANQARAERAIILGSEELSRGMVLVRELESGEEHEVSLDSLVD